MNKEIYKELEELDSVLSKFSKNDIFSAENEYFEKMQDSVFSRLEIQKKSKKISSFRINKWMIGMAASLVIIVAVVFLINTDSNVSDKQVSNDAIIEYLSLYVDDLNELDIANYLSDSDFAQGEEATTNIEDIEEYLENDIDNISEEELQQLL